MKEPSRNPGDVSGPKPRSADHVGLCDFMTSSYLGTPERITKMMPAADTRSAHQGQSTWGIMRPSLDGSRSVTFLFGSWTAPMAPDAQENGVL